MKKGVTRKMKKVPFEIMVLDERCVGCPHIDVSTDVIKATDLSGEDTVYISEHRCAHLEFCRDIHRMRREK